MIVVKSGADGNTLTINSENQLLAKARDVTSEEHLTGVGKSFIWHGECHLAAATDGGLMAFTSSEQDMNIHLTRIYFDAQSLSDNIIIYQVMNPTISGGTNISSTGVINKNFASGRTLNGVLKISDGSADLTYTDGTNYHAIPIASLQSLTRDVKGTNLLGNTDTILWGWKTVDGANAVDGEIISLSVNIFVEA